MSFPGQQRTGAYHAELVKATVSFLDMGLDLRVMIRGHARGGGMLFEYLYPTTVLWWCEAFALATVRAEGRCTVCFLVWTDAMVQSLQVFKAMGFENMDVQALYKTLHRAHSHTYRASNWTELSTK